MWLSSKGGLNEEFSRKFLKISGRGMFSFSCFLVIILIQFLITDRFLSHRKSIFNKPIVSIVGQSYWLTVHSVESSLIY